MITLGVDVTLFFCSILDCGMDAIIITGVSETDTINYTGALAMICVMDTYDTLLRWTTTWTFQL
jgi:hypothetical protein